MAARDPSYCKSHDASDWLAVDGSALIDMIAGVGCPPDTVIDDDTVIAVAKIGKAPDDVMRVEVDSGGLPAVDDTVTIHFGMTHNFDTAVILAYGSSFTDPVETGKLTYAVSGGTPAVFTITQAFIDELTLNGAGDTWAFRFSEDGGFSGNDDISVNEVDLDITAVGGPALSIPVAMYQYRLRRSARL